MGHVRTVERAGVVLLTIDRPPANAMDRELLADLLVAADRLAADVPPAVVLTGRAGCFSAGVDLKAIPGYDRADQRRMVDGINRMALGFYGLPCPVVCSITGHAIAGGFVLALCGDHRVASAEGRYGLTEVKVGVPYPPAAMYRQTKAQLRDATLAALRTAAAHDPLHDGWLSPREYHSPQASSPT